MGHISKMTVSAEVKPLSQHIERPVTVAGRVAVWVNGVVVAIKIVSIF